MSFEGQLSGETMQKQESGKSNLELPFSRISAAHLMCGKDRKSLAALVLMAAFTGTVASAQQVNDSKPEHPVTPCGIRPEVPDGSARRRK
jgi:hypothetical protein